MLKSLEERRAFVQQLIDIYVFPSVAKTLFYMQESDTWITQNRSCAFAHLLTDSSPDSVFGFDGMAGYKLIQILYVV